MLTNIKISMLSTLLTVFTTTVIAQNTDSKIYEPKFKSNLPKCVGQSPNSWTLCVGTYKFPNGNIYTGEWHNGMREGNGELRIVAKGQITKTYIGSNVPAVYTGEFLGGRFNGHGLIVLDNGEKIEGEFKDNILIK